MGRVCATAAAADAASCTVPRSARYRRPMTTAMTTPRALVPAITHDAVPRPAARASAVVAPAAVRSATTAA